MAPFATRPYGIFGEFARSVKVNETFISVTGGEMFVRHNNFRKTRKTVLFLHGLGDSGVCFLEAFRHRALKQFNLVVPDMLGYGRSSVPTRARGYSFRKQISRCWEAVETLGAAKIYLVGHSMGGDVATLMAHQQPDRVAALINVEGNLTPGDMFISGRAVAAAASGEFDRWFHSEFMEGLVLGAWGAQSPALRRYYASLWFCRPDVFLANAREMHRRLTTIRSAFLKSPLKRYCWSSSTCSKTTRALLKSRRIPNTEFPSASHWLMIDRPDEFYAVVAATCVGK
jgi:pimeloyl-ACP methyl ester carboxylesterase